MCKNVNIDKLIVLRSEGVGVKIVHHIGGKVNVTSSVYKENNLLQKYIKMQEGGGVYILVHRS